MIKHSCVYKGLINPIQISPAGESSNDERRKIPMTDIEIARAAKPRKILDIAKDLIIAITVLILFICNPTEGGIALEQFKTAFTNFFTKMNALG